MAPGIDLRSRAPTDVHHVKEGNARRSWPTVPAKFHDQRDRGMEFADVSLEVGFNRLLQTLRRFWCVTRPEASREAADSAVSGDPPPGHRPGRFRRTAQPMVDTITCPHFRSSSVA